MSEEQKRNRVLTEHNSDGTHNSSAQGTLKLTAEHTANGIHNQTAANTLGPLLVGVIGGTPRVAYVSGSNATTTSTSLVDITGLVIPLSANAVYAVEAHLSCHSSQAAGNKYGINFSAAGASVEGAISGGATAWGFDRVTAFNTATAAYLTAIVDGMITFDGMVTTGANSGNLSMQHLKETSGTSTVYINSYLKVTRIA